MSSSRGRRRCGRRHTPGMPQVSSHPEQQRRPLLSASQVHHCAIRCILLAQLQEAHPPSWLLKFMAIDCLRMANAKRTPAPMGGGMSWCPPSRFLGGGKPAPRHPCFLQGDKPAFQHCTGYSWFLSHPAPLTTTTTARLPAWPERWPSA